MKCVNRRNMRWYYLRKRYVSIRIVCLNIQYLDRRIDVPEKGKQSMEKILCEKGIRYYILE